MDAIFFLCKVAHCAFLKDNFIAVHIITFSYTVPAEVEACEKIAHIALVWQ